MNIDASTPSSSDDSSFRLRRFAPHLAVVGVFLVLIAPQLVRGYRAWHVGVANQRLLAAAAADDFAGAAAALAAGAEPGTRDHLHRSAVDFATKNANVPLAEMLVHAGVDYDARTVLMMALGEEALPLARHLLEAGADPNADGSIAPLHFCADRGAVEMVELLLEFGADLEQPATLRTGIRSPLIAAISSNQPDEVRLRMVRVLLERGARADDEHGGRSAMDHAVRDADSRLGDLLREYGAAYGPREAVAFNRLSEVESMIRDNPEILEERYRPIGVSNPGQEPTLLGIALYTGQSEMARFLIEQGAPLDTVENYGSTPLHLAAQRGGDPQLVQLLVAQGVDINARDEYQDTPLTESAWVAPLDVISALIAAGADVNARRFNGQTALHLALSNDRLETARLLLAAGADATIPHENGQTAIDIAQSRNLSWTEFVATTSQ